MKLRTFCISCVSAVMALTPAAAMVQPQSGCEAGPPSAASYSWNFKKEANGIFQTVANDAQDARTVAARLQAENREGQINWRAQGAKWTQLKSDVNDIGQRVCRLQTIRRVLAPWQQRTVDRIARQARLIADNAQDAMVYGNNHQNRLLSPRFQQYVDTLYTKLANLTDSSQNAVEYAQVQHQYRDLRSELRSNAS